MNTDDLQPLGLVIRGTSNHWYRFDEGMSAAVEGFDAAVIAAALRYWADFIETRGASA